MSIDALVMCETADLGTPAQPVIFVLVVAA